MALKNFHSTNESFPFSVVMHYCPRAYYNEVYMFKKLFAMMTIFSLLLTSASASTGTGLKDAVDELKYGLTVEWDQKNEVVKEAHIEKFQAALRQLEAEGKLNKEELVGLALSEIQDEKVKADIKENLVLFSAGSLSSEEAFRKIEAIMEHSNQRGASWTGRRVALELLLLTTIVVGVLGLCVWITHEDRGECNFDIQ